MDVETNDKLKKAKLENGFYNIIDGKRVSAGKTLSVVDPATGKQLAIVPDVDPALLDEAVSAAQKAFSGWRAVPTSRRKAILTSMLNRIRVFLTKTAKSQFVSKNSDLSPAPRRPYRGLRKTLMCGARG
jgi:delta 1-pyrroline-5-carboxylate dehydrogenase